MVEDPEFASANRVRSRSENNQTTLAARLLKGQSSKFESVINLKTAKSLDLTIPPDVLLWNLYRGPLFS